MQYGTHFYIIKVRAMNGEVLQVEGLRLPGGIENFEDIIRDGYYYVDKTLMIKELLESGALVSLFTRPRRFGKSLDMSMLRTFLR